MNRGWLFGLVVSSLGFAACRDSEPAAPSKASVAGYYEATTFELRYQYPATAPPVVTDVIATGGSFTFTLGADGAVVGNVTIPTERVDFTFRGGTWSLDGDTVVFGGIPGTGSFIEGLVFTVARRSLLLDHDIDAVYHMKATLVKR